MRILTSHFFWAAIRESTSSVSAGFQRLCRLHVRVMAAYRNTCRVRPPRRWVMSAGVRLSILVAVFAIAVPSAGFAQGTKPAPKTAKPPAKAPATQKPATPKAAPAPTPPPPPPPTDVRYTTKYTTGDQVTDSTTFITAHRERYELGDVILLRQHDQKRNVQISKSANTYVVVADDAPVAATPAPKPAGVVTVTTTIVDLGDRKDAF